MTTETAAIVQNIEQQLKRRVKGRCIPVIPRNVFRIQQDRLFSIVRQRITDNVYYFIKLSLTRSTGMVLMSRQFNETNEM